MSFGNRKKHDNRIFFQEKLDNTANLFPAIANRRMTNVYRMSVTLNEAVDREILQQALDIVLPKFGSFCVRMRRGIFWQYFETNYYRAPKVIEEREAPCRYIVPSEQREYLFRVTYYKNKINLEVFHVLADGMGGVNFLRELVYQYLRLRHEELADSSDDFSDETSLNHEDDYVKNFYRKQKKGYQTRKAVMLRGEKLPVDELLVFHGYMPIAPLKEVCRRYGVTINEYLIGVFVYSIYQEYLHGKPSKRPVVISVPVNLRPYFSSNTLRNFFVMVSAIFEPDREGMTLEEVFQAVHESLQTQMTKEHLESLFSYNVSNQMNIALRLVPMFVKRFAMRFVYHNSAKANTTTITNIGKFTVEEKYEKYIKSMYAMISYSLGQTIKGTVSSYQDTLVFTFTSVLKDTSVQKGFFRILSEHGIPVVIESNEFDGEEDEAM